MADVDPYSTWTWGQPTAAELHALFVRPDAHGQGIGSALLRAVIQHFAAGGITALSVRVLAANPFGCFYTRLRPRRLQSRLGWLGGEAYDEVLFGWPDTTRLLQRLDARVRGHRRRTPRTNNELT